MASFPHSSGAQSVRHPIMGSAGLPQNFGPPMPVQFRPVGLPQQSHQFLPAPSHQFQHTQGLPPSFAGMPPPPPPPQFAPPVQQIISRSSHPGQSPVSSHTIAAPYIQPNVCISPGLMQSQSNCQFQGSLPVNMGGGGMPLSSSYTFSTSYDQQLNNANAPSQYQLTPQMQASVPPAAEKPWQASGNNVSNLLHDAQNSARLLATNSVQAAQQSSAGADVVSAMNAPPPVPTDQSSDWQEHASSDGKRYYYNKKTKQSSWEKPVELMTPIERADASTAWKEYTSPDGRKYYYNKLTKQSKWTIPDELKIAREQAERTEIQFEQLETGAAPVAPATVTLPPPQIPSSTATTSNFSSIATSAVGSSPFSVSLVVNSVNPLSMVASGSPSIATMPSTGISSNSLMGSTNATIMLNVTAPITPLHASSSASSVVIEDTTDTTATPPTTATTPNTPTTKHTQLDTQPPPPFKVENKGISNVSPSISIIEDVPDGKADEDSEEAKKDVTAAETITLLPQEDKPIVEEQLVYANKQEAKNAFKALLESTNIESDWTWEQAMRVIINDKRYCVLKSLGEKKQVFNEFLGERKKHENEERRIKQKKVREDFTKMLEECKEVTSSTKWRKAEAMFEGDGRFNAVERATDRVDLFESYIEELKRKEKTRAAEEHKQNIMEYRAFLESCEFIKPSSQWRKVQDRLEIDERCSRLEKFDRLKIFQDYVNDLEKEEEERQKIQKEQLRKTERKNRDEFRKLMEEHVAAGILTAKTHWRDYYMEVKDLPSYLAVSSNTSGATPKDLFEDVTEELEKQYCDDKARMKDALKMGKIALTSSSTFENLKADTSEEDSLQIISEINLKLIYNELLEKLREKEEKEVKRRQRLADNFSSLLYSAKEISASSTWEECKSLLVDCQQYSSAEESFMRGIFEKYVTHLQEREIEEHKRDERKAKKERGREDRDRRKDRKDRERDYEKEKGKHRSRRDETESENVDVIGSSSADDKNIGKDRDRKHRKHHRSRADEAEKDEKERSRKSHRHSSDHKKSRKRASESDGESRHRKQKKDRRGLGRDSSHDDLEDGELGDYGEVC